VSEIENSLVIRNTEPQFLGHGERNFTPSELRDFVHKLYRKLLSIPAQKVDLDRVGNLFGPSRKIQEHTEIDCGSTFCVFGWALTDPNLCTELGVAPEIKVIWSDSTDPLELTANYTRTGERAEYYSILTVDEHWEISNFLFDAQMLDDLIENDESADKVEALLRCACVFYAMGSSAWMRNSSEGCNPFTGDIFTTESYRYMHERGYLESAFQMLKQDGIDITSLETWRAKMIEANWADVNSEDI
jgi:hypothetical protein